MPNSERAQLSAPDFPADRIEGLAAKLFNLYRLRSRASLAEIVQHGYRFEDVFRWALQPVFEIEIEEDVPLGIATNGEQAIGAYDFATNVVFTDPIAGPQSGNPKRTFMRYHEAFGHAALHGPWLREHVERARLQGRLLDTAFTLSDRCRETLERQANRAAAEIAAPMLLVDEALRLILQTDTRQLKFVGPGEYSIGARNVTVESFEHFCREISRSLQPSFDGLSMQALGYRVMRSRWVENQCVSSPSKRLWLYSTVA